MLPMKPVRLQLGELLAADVTTLGIAGTDHNTVALIAGEFNLNENLAFGELTLATFTGSTPLECGNGTQLVGIDPVTQEQRITLKTPVGGWRWEATALTNLPESIYGAVLINDAGDAYLAAMAFDEPITIQQVGDEVNLGVLDLVFVSEPLS